MANFVRKTIVQATAIVALVCLSACATFGAPVTTANDASLTPSQFASSVLRELLPAPAVDDIEAQARTAAFKLNKDGYRSADAPAAFHHWLTQTLQAGGAEMNGFSGEYRTAVNGLEQFRTAVEGLSKLKFSKPQVEFVAKFLRSYFSADKPSLNPRDILSAFQRAVADLNNNTNVSEAEKRAAQFRVSITAEVGAAASEVVTIASTVVADVVAVDTVALEATGSYLGMIMNALEAVNNLPWYVTAPLSIAFPPLNPILYGMKAIPCFYNARGAWTFQSTAAWGPWMLCNVDVIKMLPLGSEIETVLTILFKVLGTGLSYAG